MTAARPPAFGCPSRDGAPPPIDERLAPPETRLEYIGGIEHFAAPADPPHARKQSQVDRVVGSTVDEGHIPAVEMLTRTSEVDDFAPDFSVYPAAPDPETGGRQLEELAFEVTSEQSLSIPTKKARELIRRGVRRVFCVLVKQRRVLEWSREIDGWATLPDDAVIEDRCLVRPVPIAALLDPALADDAVAESMLVKRPPSISRALREAEQEGVRAAIFEVLAARRLDVPEAVRAAVGACADADELRRMLRVAATAETVVELAKGFAR